MRNSLEWSLHLILELWYSLTQEFFLDSIQFSSLWNVLICTVNDEIPIDNNEPVLSTHMRPEL